MTPRPSEAPEPPRLDPDVRCAECGVAGAFSFDGIQLCAACYAEKGACCCESGDCGLPEEER